MSRCLLAALSCAVATFALLAASLVDLHAQPSGSKASLVARVDPGPDELFRGLEHLSFEAPLHAPSKVEGFHMESAPELELVFGDIQHFKNHLDRFDQLSAQMRIERRRFGRASQFVQKRMLLQKNPCKDELLARSYTEANDSGLRFRQLGARAETLHRAIRQLDRLGESSGLTPNYRRKVKQSRSTYQQSIADLEEMRALFSKELGRQLRARGCDTTDLLGMADSLPASEGGITDELLETTVVMPKHKERRWRRELPTPHRAATKTFFVDNRSCASGARVFVDGVLLGDVPAKERVAFQASSGRHDICLIDSSTASKCGDTGTRRRAFLYDGFRMTRHCDPKASK